MTSRKAGPLSHVKVLDLSRILAAPWAGQILADLGAEVVKVERPGAGDDTRSWGPPFLKGPDSEDMKEAGYYLAVNRGKRSITVSLDKPEGQRIVRELAMRSDIVLENYKAGTLERYGLDEASLRKLNPRLIYCSVTGFGQTGPRRDQPAYDFLIQAMGGLMSVTGERDGKPGGGPQKVGVPIVGLMTGMYTTVAVLAALVRRNETGIGDNIDIGMLQHVPHPSGVTVPQLASPMRFADAALQVQSAPPLLGQHSDDILAELGYGAADIGTLRTQGVIGS